MAEDDDALASEILRRADELLATWPRRVVGGLELGARLLVLIDALAGLERSARAALAAAQRGSEHHA